MGVSRALCRGIFSMACRPIADRFKVDEVTQTGQMTGYHALGINIVHALDIGVLLS